MRVTIIIVTWLSLQLYAGPRVTLRTLSLLLISTPGKIVTYVDGYKKKGKHNCYPSKAVDVAVQYNPDNSITWDIGKYKPLLGLAKTASAFVGKKITSGGSWKKLRDYPHLEI